MSGWPECALPSTPCSKKSASALASWCWPGRPPSSAAPQRSRLSRRRAGHRQRCTGRWLARRAGLCRPFRCVRLGLLRGHPSRARPRLQHTAPARPTGPATPLIPPPAGRAPTTCGAGGSGHLGTGITSPGVAGGTTATARGMATAHGTTVIADGITVAGRTPSAGIGPVTAIGKGDQAKKVTRASTDSRSVRRGLWRTSQAAQTNCSAPRVPGSADERIYAGPERFWGRPGCLSATGFHANIRVCHAGRRRRWLASQGYGSG